MADTFFGFDTSLNNGERIGSPDEIEVLETEEEYDALNDETFGALEENELDDWEQQHEQFAEIAESSRHSDHIESTLSQLVLDENDSTSAATLRNSSSLNNSVWSYNANSNSNSTSLNDSILSSLQKSASAKAFVEANNKAELNKQHHQQQQHLHQNDVASPFQNRIIAPGGGGPQSQLPPVSGLLQQNNVPKKVCTVEELERSLLNNRNKLPTPNAHQQQQQQQTTTQQQQQQYHGFNMQPPSMPPGRLPPGLNHPMGLPPGLGHMQQMGQMPMRLMRMVPPMPPHFMPQGPPPPPGMMYPGNAQFPFFNLPPNHQHPNHQLNRQQQQNSIYHHQQQQQHQQQNHNNNNNNSVSHMLQQQQQQQKMHQQHMQHLNQHQQQQQQQRQQPYDEYAGLMNNREKQWLLNIQLIQLNTGTPYFDDYYYTVFKERQRSLAMKGGRDGLLLPPNGKFGANDANRSNSGGGGRWNNGRDGRRGQDQQEQQQQQQQHRVYTPLQFENSLGKLQFGSVTAPRKIIDMDIVTPDKDSEVAQTSRDTRKTKQLLLELEALYTMLLKAEDLRNPMAISNMEKLKELKQKQRLRELDVATTSEQKTEILKLLQQESLPSTENTMDCLTKVVNGLVQDDKLASFLAIRKGKMLLLRLLSNIGQDTFGAKQTELWTKVLLSIPAVGRRDTAGDNLLPQLHSHFKRFVQCRRMDEILDIVTSLIEVIKQQPDNVRSTPLSHQGKAPLHFIVGNKFGISTLATMMTRTEYLISSSNASDKQQVDWSNFVINLAETLMSVSAFACPLETINADIFNKHMVRIANLTPDKRTVLEKAFVVDV